MRRLGSFAALVLLFAVPFLQGCYDSPRALRNRCRANLNTLSSDMAMFRVTTGFWAETTASLDSMAGRDAPLVCPGCSVPYILESTGEGYLLTCPDPGHGRIHTGTPDWGP